MTKASDNAFPSVLITEGTEPSAPAAGKQRLYIDSTSHHLSRTNSSGVETDIEGQAASAANLSGWTPMVHQYGYSTALALSTAETVAANGGSVAVGMIVPARMRLQSVSVRNTDTGTARSWDWDLYQQSTQTESAGENSLARIIGTSGPDAFTPGGSASTRTLAASAVTTLVPGFYWLVIQNQHATNSFGLAYTDTSNAFGPNLPAQIKTTTNPNGATLDFVAATWTKNRRVYAVYLRGYVFGESAVF